MLHAVKYSQSSKPDGGYTYRAIDNLLWEGCCETLIEVCIDPITQSPVTTVLPSSPAKPNQLFSMVPNSNAHTTQYMAALGAKVIVEIYNHYYFRETALFLKIFKYILWKITHLFVFKLFVFPRKLHHKLLLYVAIQVLLLNGLRGQTNCIIAIKALELFLQRNAPI